MMNVTKAIVRIVLAATVLPSMLEGNDATFSVTEAGKPNCTVVAITGDEPELLMTRAVESITGTVRRWGGVELPVVAIKGGSGAMPAGPAIVLATLERLRKSAPEIVTSTDAVRRVGFMDEHGFACVAVGI